MSSESARKVLITCKIPDSSFKLLEHQLKPLNVSIIGNQHREDSISKEEIIANISETSGLYCILEDRIDKQVLSAAKHLKVISTLSVGYDHIDTKECQSRGISVGNTPGVLTETTADLTLALMMAVARRLPEAAAAVKDGGWTKWKSEWLCGHDLSGSTVGIIGFGRIGQAVAKRVAHGFGCKVLYTGPHEKADIAASLNARHVDMDTLLRESDFVTPHCALNENTKNLFNSKTFQKMKKTSIFINTTRGGVVDQDALYDALKSNTIFAAGLDVTSPEPLPTNHKLLTLPNLLILPHIGSASFATRGLMGEIAAWNLIKGLTGQPLLHKVV